MPRPVTAQKSRRNRDIAAIHAAAKQLGMDDGAYRDMLFVVTRQRSCAALDFTGLQRVRDHLGKLGATFGKAQPAKGKNEWAFVFRCTPERQPYLKKLYRLAQALKVGKPYIEGIAKQMLGGDVDTRLEFCAPDLLHKIVQAVEVYKRRQGVA